MPLSNTTTGTINTIPVLSVAGAFSYTFEIPQGGTAQVLWAQLISAANAAVGVRQMVMQVSDEASNPVFSINYFATQTANSTLVLSFFQGLTIIPQSIVGTVTTIPTEGLFVSNGWTLEFVYSPLISALDVFTGNFQSRGLHNSGAPR